MGLSKTILLMPVLLACFTLTPYAYALTPEEAQVLPYKFISMSISVSICALAGGLAVARTGAASIASITEKPELLGRTMIYVGLAEGIAIYGLLVALLIWIT